MALEEFNDRPYIFTTHLQCGVTADVLRDGLFVIQAPALHHLESWPVNPEKQIAAIEGARPTQGKLDAVDPDGDPLTFSLDTFQKLAPGFSFQPDGQWRFDPADPAWRSTPGGVKRQSVMRFRATDPYGGRGNLTLTLEITGVNNPPEATTPPDVRIEQGSAPAEGQVQARDVDENAKLSFEVLGDKAPDGFTLRADGRWRFDPAHAAYKELRKGEFRSLFVPIKITDDAGGITVVRLQITLSGSQP
jgi:VCBS repeat-containing protein